MIQMEGEAEADTTVAGELELLAAMFRTLIVDSRSTSSVVRADIQRFLGPEHGPEWWGELLGLGDGFALALRRRLTSTARYTTHRTLGEGR